MNMTDGGGFSGSLDCNEQASESLAASICSNKHGCQIALCLGQNEKR